MKNLFRTLLLLALFPTFLFAQTDSESLYLSSEPFIYTLDGTVLMEDDFSVKKSFLMRNFLDRNGEPIPFSDIKYFQDDRGYFGVLHAKGRIGSGYSIMERSIPGTVNLFEKTSSSTSSDGITTSSKTYYYAVKMGDMTLMNYDNLKRDLLMKDERDYRQVNAEVMEYLEKGKRKKTSKLIQMVAGLGMFGAGMVIFGTADEETSSNTRIVGLGVTVLGGAVAGTSGLFHNHRKSYTKAIEAYNTKY